MKKNSIDKYKLVAIDTNIFIYHFTRQSEFHLQAEDLLLRLLELNKQVVTSVLTLTELLSFKTDYRLLQELEKNFLSFPNLEVREVTTQIAKEAANIRRNYEYSLADAIQLATAVVAKAEAFLTNDQKLKDFKEIKVVTLEDLKP